MIRKFKVYYIDLEMLASLYDKLADTLAKKEQHNEAL